MVNDDNMVQISAEMVYNYQQFNVKGKLVYRTTQYAKQEFSKLLKFADVDGYIVDMTQITQIDSTGFGVLINFAKRVNLNNNRIVIILRNNFIKELFKIAKLDKLFPIVDHQEEAVKLLKEGFKTEMIISDY